MESILLQDPPCEVRLRRNARARRLTLRIETGRLGAVLTLPPQVNRFEAQCFLDQHTDWLRKALARQPDFTRVVEGTRLPVAGEMVTIHIHDGKRHPPQLSNGRLLVHGSGPVGPRVAAWLRMEARDRLMPAARSYARRLGRRIDSISLRDTRSRWGSCSSRGALSFSWRLAMAPCEVADYVAAHEAAHLVEMNHSPRYWAVLASLMPDYDRHRGWLRQHGRTLHAYRFD